MALATFVDLVEKRRRSCSLGWRLYLTIPIDEADSEPLVGMSLMEGYQLTVQVFEEGSVEIRKVSAVFKNFESY